MMLDIRQSVLQFQIEPLAWSILIGIDVEGGMQTLIERVEQLHIGILQQCRTWDGNRLFPR